MHWTAVAPEALKLAEEVKVDYASALAEVEKTGQALWLHARTKQRSAAPELGAEPWVPVSKMATLSGIVRTPISALQLVPNSLNRLLGGPTPLASILAGGLLGGGVGYLGGRLIEGLVPDDVLQRGRLRKTLGIIGGLLGTLPGIGVGVLGMQNPDPGWASRWESWIRPNRLFGDSSPVPDPADRSGAVSATAIGDERRARKTASLAAAAVERLPADEEFDKLADFAVAPFLPHIPVDQFNRVVWSDPNTPPAIQAATAGLTSMAGASRGGGLVSSYDIARIALGAGAGYLSASLVGKTLGALAGLSTSAQNTLQNMGTWAGALTRIVPLAFGG